MTDTRFTLRLEPALKHWLEQEAERQDRSAGWVAKQAIASLKEATEARNRMIDDAVTEADKGEFVSQQAVHGWLKALEGNPEAPPPEPDISLPG